MQAVCKHSARISNVSCVVSEVSSGRSNENRKVAMDMKGQRNRTGQRLVVLIDRRRSRPREVMDGA